MELFVNGTLMRGLALHRNLCGAEFLGEFETEPRYRLHSILEEYPGMYEIGLGGSAIKGELYRMNPEIWERVAASEPAGLYKGTVRLRRKGLTQGILCRRELAALYPDISRFGGWRSYMASRDADRSTDH